MPSDESTQEDVLHDQVLQLREIIASHKNMESRSISIEPSEIIITLIEKLDENESIHPRLLSLDHGATDIDEMETALMRLENDLHDVREINDQKSLYDPHKHELNGDSEAGHDSYPEEENVEQDKSESRPQNIRDKEQRPLSAYSNIDD